nr:helix-turn-helix domain-containing protein [uncultured Desulfobacter sp.]
MINKSIQLFWLNGFSESSMQQVVKVTYLKPGSIYHAFGNKEGLFREALDNFWDFPMSNDRLFELSDRA